MSAESDLDIIINYLHDNYYNDCERMARIKMVQAIASQGAEGHNIPNLVDKVALFNGIKKSYPPELPTILKGIKKIGNIFYDY